MGKDFDEFEAMFGNMNGSEVQIASDSTTQRVVEENTPRQMNQDLQMNNTMSQAPTVQKRQSLSKGVGDDFEIGFSKDMEDSLSEMGIEVGDIGVKISKVPI